MKDYYEYAIRSILRAQKEKPKVNGYKNKAERVCFYTGKTSAERHEVFGGTANRKISVKYGFQIDLCPEKHKELQDNITPWAKIENEKWRRAYERAYIAFLKKTKDLTFKQAYDEWMLLIGRNYV